MKNINKYFKDKDLEVKYLDGYDIHINRELLLEIIKEIQIDTIRETCQACANSAEADVTFQEWGKECQLDASEYRVYIIKSSILSVADKLIKRITMIAYKLFRVFKRRFYIFSVY